MQIYNYVMLAYFALVVMLINWKGNAFLRLPVGTRLLIAGAFFMPLVTWVVVFHIANS